jgi:predicted transcriptional regulator
MVKEEYKNPVGFLKNPESWGADRQRVILAMLTMNFSNNQIAQAVGVYPSTISAWAEKYMGELSKHIVAEDEYAQIIERVGLPRGKKAIVDQNMRAIINSDLVACKIIALFDLEFSNKQIAQALNISESVLTEFFDKRKGDPDRTSIISGQELLKIIDVVGYPENRQ